MLSDLLARLAALGTQLLQKQGGPVEETLCFSVVPIGIAVLWLALRSRRLSTEQQGID